MKIGVHRHFCLCKMKDFSDPGRLSSILTKGLASLFNCSPGVALIGNQSCAVRRCLRACLYTAQCSFPGSSMVILNINEYIQPLKRIYSAIEKNTFESVLMRWMKLEPIIQSEVSQKEKHQYSILTHIYGI